MSDAAQADQNPSNNSDSPRKDDNNDENTPLESPQDHADELKNDLAVAAIAEASASAPVAAAAAPSDVVVDMATPASTAIEQTPSTAQPFNIEAQQSAFHTSMTECVPVQLEWKDINYEVMEKVGLFKKKKKTILKSMSGYVSPYVYSQ